MMLLASIDLAIVFLLSVSEVISQCPPSSGIYLRYDGNCFPNGSYFSDSRIRPTPLECGLPGATLNGGQWIGPNGVVPCDGGNNANVECTTGSGASLSVNINPPSFLEATGDGWYKCCLPNDCSNPNTNSIFANIFRFTQIESFTVADLPSDMTVYPQEFKLNCVKIGFIRYDVMMIIGNTLLANYTNCHDPDNACPGTVIFSSTNTIRYTITVTWDGMIVSNGLINQLVTGDQMYQCRIADHPDANADRTRNITVKVPTTAPSSFTVYRWIEVVIIQSH
ncbi:PREDICTED: uncharacterized protein LOC109582326 [Amphimedon queenslandica]|uniref:Sushi domain-containing protein n=1 Tax=Amphimedon queenslandica TaxID=400682 RepID=A0AAN0J689_AMPQE|nr:PREDICTED: uncharacterized protein LOC109582326 [Amphimedon queenslandica]|eukprot:XP_019852555.1 PREDICTED: uncharacterized protein LOC109582326 [Amphimedon queenslandica]